MLLFIRNFVDLSYELLTVEPGSNTVIVSDLEFNPTLDWDPNRKCEILIFQAIADSVFNFEIISVELELSEVRMSSNCFEPKLRAILAGLGYPEVTLDTLSIEFDYSLPDSSADFGITATMRDAMVASILLEFDYFWLNLTNDRHNARLEFSELLFENKGLWGRLEPTLATRIGSEIALPYLIEGYFHGVLSENGTRTPTHAEQEFLKNLREGISAFLKEKRYLVVTAAPDGGIWLDDNFFSSPLNLINVLRPSISNKPSSIFSIVSPMDLRVALSDSSDLDDAKRMKIGKALLTGLGAPRSIDDGAVLLLPMAKKWSGEAAAMLANAFESVGRYDEAYEMALIALATGDLSVLSVADELEQRIPMLKILSIQDDISNRWPGAANFRSAIEAAVTVGDVGAIRGHANAASIGGRSPRSYSTSYMLATLAAAGGDRGAAKLRDRLDHRFGREIHWSSEANKAAREALDLWVNGGMGAAISNRVQ